MRRRFIGLPIGRNMLPRNMLATSTGGAWPFASLLRFARNRKGTTAVEFGLIAVPFLGVVCAIFEVGYVNFENELLQSSINTAARQMLTGQFQARSTPITTAAQFVSNYLCQTTGTRTLPSNFNCANLVVDVRTAATFAAGDTTNDIYKSSTTTFCPAQPGQIVVLRVSYPLGAIFPLSLYNGTLGTVSDVPNLSGKYHILLAEALFREENYAASYTPPTGC